MATIGADASASTIAFEEESAWGTTPATPTFQKIRQTGNGLTPTLSKAVSDEITSAAAVTDVIPTSGGAEGDINFEPSYGEWLDAVFEHALRDSFDSFGKLYAGNDKKSMTIERIIPVDSTPFYFRYAGARANSFALTLDATATSPITATINVMAKAETTATAIISGATYVPPNENPVMSMPELRYLDAEIGGVAKTACYTTLNLTVNNNIRMQQGKCTDVTAFPDLTAKGAGYGRREVTLDVGYYFNDLDYVTMFQANTAGKFSWVMSDGTRGYKITLPKVKILESSIPIDGNDADVIQTMSIQALLDPVTDTDVIIEKIPSLAASAAVTLTAVSTVPSPDFRGAYYKDGTVYGTKSVYASVDGLNAIWWSTAESKWAVTTYANIGTFPTVAGWSNATTVAPTGAWSAIGTATGTLTGTAYDPTA